jgi:hypothetical protein
MYDYKSYKDKFWKDKPDSYVEKVYKEYIEVEMKINTLNFAVSKPAVCAFECAPACEALKKSRFGAKVCNQEKEVENTMTTTYNEIEASRKYLNGRVQSTYWIKRDELSEQFRIHNSEFPKTYKELIDAIKNDKFTLDTKRTAKIDAYAEDDDWYGNAFDGIKFNLPTAPDHDGYNAAVNELDKKIQDVKDVINVGTPADGLKALQELEAWTPVGKAS